MTASTPPVRRWDPRCGSAAAPVAGGPFDGRGPAPGSAASRLLHPTAAAVSTAPRQGRDGLRPRLDARGNGPPADPAAPRHLIGSILL